MSWLRRLERQLQPLAIPNLTGFLIAGMVIAYVISVFNPDFGQLLEFKPKAVLKGELWRLLSFLVLPGTGVGFDLLSIFFFIVFLMATYFTGSALEATWGTLRYNVFVLIAYVSSIGAGVLVGAVIGDDVSGTNFFLYESLILAFAWLYPDFEFMVYFIFPVKAKWLGLLAVVQLTFQFIMGLTTFTNDGWLICTLILASTTNVSVFLGRDIANHLLRRNVRMLQRFVDVSQKSTARHTCIVCGATDLTHPDREFRYCTDCQGTPAYCDQHLAGHQHLTTVTTANKADATAD
jgi:hypothetical protein